MEYDPAQQGLRRGEAEHVREAGAKVGVEIVQDQMDAPRRGVDVLQQELDEATKSGLVRRAVTTTVRRPPLGSTATNRLQVPARTYS